MKTLRNNKLFTALVLACLSLASMNLLAQEKELQTESDGFRWYKLSQGGKRGAQSVDGTTLIPLNRGYSFICYQTGAGGWFRVDMEMEYKYHGVCDKTGREIVAPGRYDNVCIMNKDGYEYIYVLLNGKEGACDMNGREIIAPRYEGLIFSLINHVFEYKDASGNWVSTGISLPKSNDTNYASTTTSSDTNSSSSTREDGLLYEGDYTEGPWINPNTGYSQPAPNPHHHIKIYEDHIVIDMLNLSCSGKSINGEKMFVNSWSNITYYVDNSFNIRSTFPYGYSQFTKGNVVYDMNAPVQGGYDNGNNGSYGTTQQKHEHGVREETETCYMCHGTGNCQTCLGDHWYTTQFGQRAECPNCKDGKCSVCGGTGKITKQKFY